MLLLPQLRVAELRSEMWSFMRHKFSRIRSLQSASVGASPTISRRP